MANANANEFVNVGLHNVEPGIHNNNVTFIEKLRLKVGQLGINASRRNNNRELDRMIAELQTLIEEEKSRIDSEKSRNARLMATRHMPEISSPKKKPSKIPVGKFYSSVNLHFDTKLQGLIKSKSTADNIYIKVHAILHELSLEYNLGLLLVDGHLDQKTTIKLCNEDIANKTGIIKKGASRLLWMIKFHNAYNRGGGKIEFGELPQLEDTGYLMTSNAPNAPIHNNNAEGITAPRKKSLTSPVPAGGGKKRTKKRKPSKKPKKTKKNKKRKC